MAEFGRVLADADVTLLAEIYPAGETPLPGITSAAVADAVADAAGVAVHPSPMVNEGGGIHVDGRGTVLVTETVQRGEGRNPHWSRAQVEAELARIGWTLQPLDIVLVNTRAGSRYGNNDYVNAGCGMGYDATIYLLEKGIRLTGTDAWSWDAPFYFTAQKWAKDHDPSIIWEGHKAGRDIGYCHLEKLHNLESLPGDGFTIACFPHKIRGASAGWTRAVAIFEEDASR